MSRPRLAPQPIERTIRMVSRHRLTLAVLAPALALLAFSIWVVAEKLDGYRRSADLLAVAQVAHSGLELVRDLQKERGLSALFVGSGRTAWRAELAEQRAAATESLNRFQAVLERPQVRVLLGPRRPDIGIGRIDAARAAVDGDGALRGILEGYGTVVSRVIGVTSALSVDNASSIIAAYMDLGHVKDRVSRERVIGSAWLAQGRIDRELLDLFIEAHAERRAFIESFRAHLPAAYGQQADDILNSPAMAELERVHDAVLLGSLAALDGAAWTQAHSAVFDLLGGVEETLARDMEESIAGELERAKFTFYLVVMVVLALVAFSLETLRRSERRAWLAQEEARKLFRAVEQSPVSVVITDPHGLIEYVNPDFTRVTGFTREEVLGHNPRMLKSGVTPPSLYQDLWRTIRAGHEWRGELRNRRKDGSLYWESMTIAPVKGADGQVINYIALKEDVTLRKQAEEEVNHAREAAEMANRAKSEFLATMSHELRTPLNAIIGFSEIIEGQLLGPVGLAQYVDYAHDINESGRHLLQLINDILDVSRLDVGRVALREEELDLAAVLRSAVALVRERAEKAGLELSAELADDLPRLWADERRVKQMVVNVLANAVKFTPAGGRVEVTARATHDGALDILIADTGIGIAPEDVAKVMAPFAQVDSGLARRYEGSGLGLPLTRKLLELHNGTIRLDSALGVGTTVTLRFPRERVRLPHPA